MTDGRVAWFDLASGVSGDMVMAALAGAGRALGVDAAGAMSETVARLGLECSVRFEDGTSGGLSCTRAVVEHGGRPVSIEDLRRALAPDARAARGLELLLEAESAAHGTHDVHLHELGTADTAVDLAGTSAGFAALDVRTVTAAAVPLAAGWTSGGHGDIPLPGPAVLHMLRGAKLTGAPAGAELVTPTGVAVLLAHDVAFIDPPPMTLRAVGVGAGSSERERPNVCRVLVGDPEATDGTEQVVVLEANIDDQTPEALGHAVGALLDAGALDAWLTPVVMKRSRPGLLLSVLAAPGAEADVVRSIFRLTSTLGVRRRRTERWVLPREEVVVNVRGEPVRVKVGRLDGEAVTISPEYADCARLAEAWSIPLEDVYALARSAARDDA